jgi:MoxR-like ATPase
MKDDFIARIKELIAANPGARIELSDSQAAECQRAKTRLEISKLGYVTHREGSKLYLMKVGTSAIRRTPVAPSASDVAVQVKANHTYVAPAIAEDVIAILNDERSHIVQLVGPTGCGKSTLVKHIGERLGRKVFQINCRGDMGSESFMGEKTIVVDAATGLNRIAYQSGVVEKAMREGLDADGNETGAPGILFVDEITACPAHIAHVLNRLFESDSARRTIVLDLDGGREVVGHGGLRIIIAGNTVGRGAMDMAAGVYTAQMDALDLSLLSRVAATFRMGYDRTVEQGILMEKIGDDRIVSSVVKFRDAIRQHIRAGKLTTPFTTRHIISIADMFRVFKSVPQALYLSMFEQLLPEEKAAYNEQAMAIFGVDILNQYSGGDIIDYM